MVPDVRPTTRSRDWRSLTLQPVAPTRSTTGLPSGTGAVATVVLVGPCVIVVGVEVPVVVVGAGAVVSVAVVVSLVLGVPVDVLVDDVVVPVVVAVAGSSVDPLDAADVTEPDEGGGDGVP